MASTPSTGVECASYCRAIWSTICRAKSARLGIALRPRGDGLELEGLELHEALAPTPHSGERLALPTPVPVEEREAGRFPEQRVEARQPRPIGVVCDQPLLHAVRQDVAEAVELRLHVEHRLAGKPALPERPVPAVQHAELPREVRQQELHEPRQRHALRTHQKVQVVGHEEVPAERNPVAPRGARENAPDDVSNLRRRTQQQSPMNRPRRHEVDALCPVHPNCLRHAFSPPSGRAAA
jgi:hypothetical protein